MHESQAQRIKDTGERLQSRDNVRQMSRQLAASVTSVVLFGEFP
jgi:hypothetical protein